MQQKLFPNVIKEISDLYQNGKSCQDISDAYGVSRHAIRYFLKKHGFKSRTRKEARHISHKGAHNTVEDFWKNVDRSNPDGCWPWMLKTHRAGYGLYSFQGKTWASSRLAWFLTYGDPGPMFVCHHCDNPSCCNPAHFFLGTPKDNIQDQMKKGRHWTGKGNSVLTEEQVKQIRIKHTGGLSVTKLGKEFEVNSNTIRAILKGLTWNHVQ